MRGRGRIYVHGTSSKTEQSYAGILELKKRAGEIYDYWHEPFSLRLAPKTFYKPDFLVQLPDGILEVHEVKGHWEDDARVKWKVAADKYPCFAFVAIQYVKRQWIEERL
jgi:hypothetical protein